jgi:hypothetical protein
LRWISRIDTAPVRKNLDPDKIIRTQCCPLARLMAMIAAGQISDALTVLALHRTWLYLHGVSESRPPT